MEILFLGTGAADASPLLDTRYAHCFDKAVRRNSAALLDGHILLDCGPHALSSLALAGVSPAMVTDLLVTHVHSDHIDPASVSRLAESGALNIWCEAGAAPVFASIPGARLHMVRHGEPVTMGDMKATPLFANHRVAHLPGHRPLHYLLESGGKKMFYGCDGAWLLADTYYRLKDARLDLMVLDATVGDYAGDYRMAEHNSIPMLRLMIPSLRQWGTLKDGSAVCLSHLARTLHPSHEEVCAGVSGDGFLVAYDGMKLKI